MSLRVIYKYPFEIHDDVRILMPQGATILHVDVQAGTPTIWALVDKTARTIERRFRIVGTGHSFDPTGLLHVATFQQPPFVWHLFEQVAA